MSDLPGDLLFTKDHEWLRREEDGHHRGDDGDDQADTPNVCS